MGKDGVVISIGEWKQASEEARADALVNHIYKEYGGVFIIEQGNEIIVLPLVRF